MKKVRGLKNLLYGIPIAVASFLPMKNSNAQEHVVVPFIQPNHSDLNWYGSGDVNNDNTLNWNDISRLDSIINENYIPNLNSENPAEYRTLDRADINGDGVVDYEDKNLLEDRLNGSIDYLPGEWDKSGSKSEREEWLQKMLEIDKTDTASYLPEDYTCQDFARQTMLNLHGFPELGYDKEKGLRDNGRFNIPMMYVEIAGKHALNTTITGDNLEKFTDGFYTEPQTDWTVVPGMQSMPENCEVVINYSYTAWSESQQQYVLAGQFPIMKFELTNGNSEIKWDAELENIYNNPDIKIIQQRENNSPEISRSSPLENEVYNENPKLEYNIYDENFKSAKYSLDNGETWNSLSQSGTKNLDLENDNYKLLIEAEDYLYNKSRDSVNFTVNKINSLEEQVLNSKTKFYPNPVSTTATLEHGVGEDINVNIYNTAGQRVYSKKENDKDGKVEIDFSDYTPGVYFYQTNTGSSGKIIKR